MESGYLEIHKHTLETLVKFHATLNEQLHDYIGEKFNWEYSNIEDCWGELRSISKNDHVSEYKLFGQKRSWQVNVQ